jgi:putative Holliday junction resolvase
MRVLGLDWGGRRIGTAVSDERGVIAFPLGFVERSNPKGDLAALERLIAEHGVSRVVVGLPIHMDGRRGPEADEAIAFAGKLAAATGLAVETLDERWTTVEAERALRASSTGRGRSKRREKQRRDRVDATAAAIILRTYLESGRGADPELDALPNLDEVDGLA